MKILSKQMVVAAAATWLAMPAGPPLMAQQPVPQRDGLEMQVGIGIHTPSLSWTLGGGESPVAELTYEKVRAAGTSAGAAYPFVIAPQWRVAATGLIEIGRLIGGTARDSDFEAPDRTEWSRSISDITGDVFGKVDVGLELLHALPDVRLLNHAEIRAGLTIQQVTYRMQRGRQIIPDLPSDILEGLDSRYRARWHGPWLGGAISAPVRVGTLRIMAKQHFHTAYSGEGEWNLRKDLMQPRSFIQRARGSGTDLTVSLVADAPLGMDIMFEGGVTSRAATHGHDIEFLSTGDTLRTHLTRVAATHVSFRILLSRSQASSNRFPNDR